MHEFCIVLALRLQWCDYGVASMCMLRHQLLLLRCGCMAASCCYDV